MPDSKPAPNSSKPLDESPGLAALWDTMGAAQVGLDTRRQEIVEDLAELAKQEQHWTAEAAKAWDANRDGDHKHAQSQLQACRQLRTQLMHDLGPDPERYGVQPEQTLEPEDERGSALMRTIEPADGGSDDGPDHG